MTFLAYIFPASRAEFGGIRLDSCNVTEPARIYSGPHATKRFLPAALAEREPRWIPLFQPLIADPANEVQLVDLDEADIVAPEIHPA